MNKSCSTFDKKWQAVISCDKSYDGLFFYGVKTTGIFCRPSCRAKTPICENVVFFDTAANAIAAGFRPCKKRQPDKEVFEPDIELVKKAQEIFNLNYDKSINLKNISTQLGVSVNHLIKLFKQHSGVTPSQYITKLRIDKSLGLLAKEDISIIEIA